MAAIEHAEDDDPAGEHPGKHGAKRAAFEEPKAGDKLLWRGYMELGPIYQSYVIKAEFDANGNPTFAEPYLHFRFLKRDGSFGKIVHGIDLNDQRLVWRELPSTLENLSSTRPCAFLFLTEKLADRAPSLWSDGNVKARATILEGGTGGTGKWPRAAGALATVENLLEKLRAGIGLSEHEEIAMRSLTRR